VNIAVITPTLPGREDLLEECKASVAALGLRHLIALDTGRHGPALIRNALAAQTDARWLLFLDDDDLLLPNYLDVVRPHLATADVVYTNWELSGADEPRPHPFDEASLRRFNFIPVTACVRARAFRAVGGFPTDAVLEDHGLWLALLDHGYRFTHVPTIAWHYRRHAGSRTDTAPYATY
jgi:GT2 family glycosyltransferase